MQNESEPRTLWEPTKNLGRAVVKKHRQFRKPAAKGRQKPALTTRERKIVALVVDGFKDKEIAQRMLQPERTVKAQLAKICAKLGVSDRLELVFFAVDNQLVPTRNIKGRALPPMKATQSTPLPEVLKRFRSKPM